MKPIDLDTPKGRGEYLDRVMGHLEQVLAANMPIEDKATCLSSIQTTAILFAGRQLARIADLIELEATRYTTVARAEPVTGQDPRD